MKQPPSLNYQPRDPVHFRPQIGLIGCGDITRNHLRAYRRGNYRVTALCDLDESRAHDLRDEFYPQANVFANFEELLSIPDIEVVDITTHPPERPQLIEAALCAGKHVLSQKPFVLDLDVGEQLVNLAAEKSLRLAVNQNGRWAPHFSFSRAAVAAALIGDITGVDMFALPTCAGEVKITCWIFWLN